MYLHIVGHPSAAFTFCHKCDGKLMPELPEDEEASRQVYDLLARQMAKLK